MSYPPCDLGLGEDRELALAIARQAGALVLSSFPPHPDEIWTKSDNTEVTQADLAAERLVRAQLAQHRPRDSIQGEELPGFAGEGSRVWMIDPIDGTAAFIRGVPTFSTLIAMYDEHGPAVGVMVAPALNREMSSARGSGYAQVDGSPATLSTTSSLARAVVSTSGLHLWNPRELALMTNASARIYGWGDAFGFLLLLSGQVDAIWDPGAAESDVAAMRVIVAEAGGMITAGPAGRGWLASNGRVHDELTDLLLAAIS